MWLSKDKRFNADLSVLRILVMYFHGYVVVVSSLVIRDGTFFLPMVKKIKDYGFKI